MIAERRNSGPGDSGARKSSGRGRSQDRRDEKGRTRNRGTSGGPRQFSSSAPSKRTRQADPARLAAFETLTAVSRDDAYANLVLPGRIAAHRLDQRDAGFATELAYGALRGQGLYDAVLAVCVDRPLAQLDRPVLDALRLGAHQLLAMRVPAHAALDSTVALVRDQIGAGPSGFVNAVLRKVTVQDREAWLDRLAPLTPQDAEAATTPDDVLAIRHSHPVWIIRALRQSLANHGRPADRVKAELVDLLEADNAAPVVNLVALPGLGDLDPVLEAGAEPGPLAPDSALYHGGDAGRLPGVKEGTVRVQDVGSQLTAHALTRVPLGGEGGDGGGEPGDATERWLDLCAGPGGKASLLAALARQRGANLLANEPAEHRARLVERALEAVPRHADSGEPTWSVRCGDGRELDPEHAESFDRILVDAPCTGLGALRRRPESRWRRQPSDLGPLTELQRQLLDSAVGALRPGGVLGYVTCSPHPAETVFQVQDALRRHPGLELLDTTSFLTEVAPSLTEAGGATGHPGFGDGTTSQLWPHLHSTDAMFMALFRKAGSPASGSRTTGSHQAED
ncbi:transcription antitermination factor NusB [Citricoccus sp. I39-566]|uniref:RsmB/NOP family class I SAM-dependent RNA methyltransferase n=1 Tax=Citricoccus sp. I39-566 TaxID=3073268 RepID=UPI00286B4DCE|nr:transcription antitermination factor NusB [Citricoccus sp. I39-566]WMY77259.1 transcription antitermination factor NusB [Citricoccus sp. I39-566]